VPRCEALEEAAKQNRVKDEAVRAKDEHIALLYAEIASGGNQIELEHLQDAVLGIALSLLH
jgi:hypothetical protein